MPTEFPYAHTFIIITIIIIILSSFCRHLVATKMAHIVFGRINMNRLI